MNINIYGSTGIIGIKTLNLLKRYYPEIKINLLCAKSNINLLLKQIKDFNPKYVFLSDFNKAKILKSKVNNKTKIINYDDLIKYLESSKSTYSILAISGYKSLYFLEHIINNSDNVGIASKEAIVSAGHIFKKKKYFVKTNIFPLDSEHFSLFEYLKGNYLFEKTKKIILTASGGPFFNKKFKNLKNIKFQDAINHPKWNMGYKNSIDSATLVNKCLELIEAHYLFQIPFEKLSIKIHPEALVHSIVQKENYVSHMNFFRNDMDIPISNFLNQNYKKFKINNKKLEINEDSNLNFFEVTKENFPIYDFFKKIDKNHPHNLIKFNIGNEFAVNLFKNKKIAYTDIYTIIKKATSLNLYSSLNNIKEIIDYHEKFEKKLKSKFKNII